MATETRPDAAPLATQFEDAPLRDVPTGRGRSIAQRLLAGLLLISMLATAVATLGAFMVFRREAEAQRIAALDAYVTERAKYQQALFDSLVADQRGARLALLRELVAAKRSRAEDRFEALFPLSPDGARHAAPALWTGLERDDGASIYGVTGFMAPGPISTEERRLLVTAMEVVSRLGESVRTKTDNFYFYTLNDQMVMFAPDHPSKARFYAQAPASFTIADKPVAKVIQPGANPTRETRCTPLSPLMSDPTGRTLTTGCMTPVYLDGRLLGAFGSTLEIGSYLHRALADPAPDAENLVIDSNGRLIAFPGFGRPGELTGERVAAFERRLQPAMLASAIRAQSASDGVIRSPDGKNIIGYARIPGAGWYFLSVSPPGGDFEGRDAVVVPGPGAGGPGGSGPMPAHGHVDPAAGRPAPAAPG